MPSERNSTDPLRNHWDRQCARPPAGGWRRARWLGPTRPAHLTFPFGPRGDHRQGRRPPRTSGEDSRWRGTARAFTTRVDFKASEHPLGGNFDVSSNFIVKGTRVSSSSVHAWSQYESRATPTSPEQTDGWEMLVEVIGTYDVDASLDADALDLDAFALIVGSTAPPVCAGGHSSRDCSLTVPGVHARPSDTAVSISR